MEFTKNLEIMIKYLKGLFRKTKSNIQDLIDNDTSSEVKTDEYCIYYRPHGRLKVLEEEDIRRGYGLNTTHYSKVNKKREELGLPLRSDYRDMFEHIRRDGKYLIDGTKIVSKYHPLHDKMLVDNETGIRYHIDTVSTGYHYGMILSLSTRKEGTKSHGVIDWEVIVGGNMKTIKRVEDNHKRYRLEDI